jgi:acetyl esterase/lipase
MYLNENKDLIQDPYVSPLMIHPKMIQKIPEMSIYFGTKDPLYDEGLRLFQKMIQNGHKTYFKNYKGLFHGVLSLTGLDSLPM